MSFFSIFRSFVFCLLFSFEKYTMAGIDFGFQGLQRRYILPFSYPYTSILRCCIHAIVSFFFHVEPAGYDISQVYYSPLTSKILYLGLWYCARPFFIFNSSFIKEGKRYTSWYSTYRDSLQNKIICWYDSDPMAVIYTRTSLQDYKCLKYRYCHPKGWTIKMMSKFKYNFRLNVKFCCYYSMTRQFYVPECGVCIITLKVSSLVNLIIINEY